MTLQDLYHGHFQQLTKAFGISNALSAYRDDRLARAWGDSVG